jgi:hypothetical protein
VGEQVVQRLCWSYLQVLPRRGIRIFVNVEVRCTMDSEVEREAALFVDRFV